MEKLSDYSLKLVGKIQICEFAPGIVGSDVVSAGGFFWCTKTPQVMVFVVNGNLCHPMPIARPVADALIFGVAAWPTVGVVLRACGDTKIVAPTIQPVAIPVIHQDVARYIQNEVLERHMMRAVFSFAYALAILTIGVAIKRPFELISSFKIFIVYHGNLALRQRNLFAHGLSRHFCFGLVLGLAVC